MSTVRWLTVAGAVAVSCAIPPLDIVDSLGNAGASNAGAAGRTGGDGGGDAGASADAGAPTLGGGGSGGTAAGGASGGGSPSAGAPQGGVPTGGAATGGAATSGTGGAPAGGASGAPAGGTAGAPAGGTGGTAGTGGASGTPYCDTHSKNALPYVATSGFKPTAFGGDMTAISFVSGSAPCAARVAGAVGDCYGFTYSPNVSAPAPSFVAFSTVWDQAYTHPPVCLVDGATKVTFAARGSVGGEKVQFAAAGVLAQLYTLTNAWAPYTFSLGAVKYNTDASGVTQGFYWQANPTNPLSNITFFVDNVKWEQ